MEIENNDLIFERASNTEALSSFSCGVRELDLLIHRKTNGLREFIATNDCEAYVVFHQEEAVAVFVYSKGTLETTDGNHDATEIDFIAVRDKYRNQKIGTKILEAITSNSILNGRYFLMVGAFINKRYSAIGFYEKHGFEPIDERQGNILPMFKEL